MAKFYSNAAWTIQKVLQKKGTPKTLVIENNRIRNKKKLYALVCEAMKYKPVTDTLLENTKLLSMEKQLKYPMALVLVYDFLFGRGLQVGGQLKQVINRNKTCLQAALARMKVRAKVFKNEDLLPRNIQQQQELQIPRYVRVNTLKTSTDEVIKWFSDNGFKLLETKQGDMVDSLQMSSGTFSIDEHIPNVLVFSPGTDLHDNILYEEGKIILQDKASCFSAFVLSPPAESDVIDACAAPGNKTSHLAAIMNNKGRIFAFDISEKRISTMKKLLERSGENIVQAKHEDFLKVNSSDPMYSNVQYILVDPSCSGSGIINRLDYVTSDNNNMNEKEKQRVYSLAQFQIKVLSHAMSFPNVKKVVYSTCSLHNMENEEVVIKCLEEFQEKFELKTALSDWLYRGRNVFPQASKCIRASPREGSTNGFFLALFERRNLKETITTNKEIQKDADYEAKYISQRKRSFLSTENNKTDEICDHFNSNTATNLTTKKRTCITDHNEKTKLQRKSFKLIRTHRKCSHKEFENRAQKLFERRTRSKKKTQKKTL